MEELKSAVADLQKRLEELKAKETDRVQKQSETQMDMREYTGVVRETARDLESMLNQSHFTALTLDRLDRLAPVLDNDRFPGMEEITILSDLFFEEAALSGEIDRHEAAFIDSGGGKVTGEILTIGAFSAVYRNDGEVGFLRYTEGSRQFFRPVETAALDHAPQLERLSERRYG